MSFLWFQSRRSAGSATDRPYVIPPMDTRSSLHFTIRDMDAGDIRRCIWVRTHTREQCWTLEALTRVGVTEDAVSRLLASSHMGWVCEQDGQIVGFSMADGSNGEFWVVAVLPDYEGRGIGRQLLKPLPSRRWLRFVTAIFATSAYSARFPIFATALPSAGA